MSVSQETIDRMVNGETLTLMGVQAMSFMTGIAYITDNGDGTYKFGWYATCGNESEEYGPCCESRSSDYDVTASVPVSELYGYVNAVAEKHKLIIAA